MAVTQEHTEQYLPPAELLLAEAVFDGIYKSFADNAQREPEVRNRRVDGKVEQVKIDAAEEFVSKRFGEAERTIGPLAHQPKTSDDVKAELMADIEKEAERVYEHSPSGQAMRQERGNRLVNQFVDRAIAMSRNGEADGLTVKAFFAGLDGIRYILSTGYNELVKKRDEVRPSKASQETYYQSVKEILGMFSDVREQKDASFMHVNGTKFQAGDAEATTRYYISALLNNQPAEVVRIWAETLRDLGLDESVYFKVPEGLDRRYETIVAYATPETESELERVVGEFVSRCPADLLSDSTLPSGVPVAKGVARAPEPGELSKLHRYRGRKSFSYNNFASAMTELSLRRAAYDFIQAGEAPEKVTPRMLSESAKPYFMQLLKLSGIDPATMRVL